MQNIINRSFLVIWLPSVAMTLLIVILSAIGINFVHKIFDFIVGNPYDISSVLIGLVWLFSMSWTLLAFLNRNTFKSDLLDHPESHGSLYKITSIRESALKHVSASAYNNESKNVIRKYNPSSKQLTEEVVIHELMPESETMPTDKSDNGEKKEEVTTTAEFAGLTATPHIGSNLPVGHATINTAIKGESHATDESKEKYREVLRKIADKRKKKQSES